MRNFYGAYILSLVWPNQWLPDITTLPCKHCVIFFYRKHLELHLGYLMWHHYYTLGQGDRKSVLQKYLPNGGESPGQCCSECHPVNRKVVGSIPSRAHMQVAGLVPSQGVCEKSINECSSLLHCLSLSLPLSIKAMKKCPQVRIKKENGEELTSKNWLFCNFIWRAVVGKWRTVSGTHRTSLGQDTAPQWRRTPWK